SHARTRRAARAAAVRASDSRSRTSSPTPSAPSSTTSRPSRAARASSSRCRCVKTSRRDRQLDGERRAATAVRSHPDPAVHPVHELAADVEAEAGAADTARELRVEAEELLEDARLLRRRDAEA